MAEMVQFYKGASITFTAYPEGDESMNNCKALVYPDNLDLTIPANAEKIVEIDRYETLGDGYVFTIPSSTSKGMEAGSYTVELYYGVGDALSIVRNNNVFVLVDSGYALVSEVGSNS